MAIPSTKATFKEYCLRSLGKPVIEINVDPDQVEDRIDEALQYFAQYHYDGIERVYLKYQITQADIDRARSDASLPVASDIDGTTTAVWKEQKNYIPVPSSVMSIVKVFPMTDKTTSSMFDIRYQLRLNDLYDFSSTSIMHYQMTMEHLDFLDHILVGETVIRHNQHQNRLYLDADFQTDYSANDYILIEAYRKVDPATYTDVWDDIFLKRYATQLIKMQWGANLSKFQGIQMLGGVALNGEQIYTQAQEEINKLEEQIQLAYELPPMHMIG
jgi:hypothetical protein|tara:strand:- start:231 stop:1046 length:816 start_codon:yes stop_codon:yes gene_type:complete